jgi:phosphomannomutase/phosphoglucomutase
MVTVNPQIFREYDIRGVVEKDLTPDIVRLLGQTYGTYMIEKGLKDVTVGRDCRLSSDEFRDALLEGILSTGCDVTEYRRVSDAGFLFLPLSSQEGWRNDDHRQS